MGMTDQTSAEQVAAGALNPTSGGDRKVYLDTLRGVALFGILLMNITGMGLPFAYGDPTNYGGAEGANLWAWISTNMLFEGTMRGLFSLMFGAGIILQMSRAEARGGGIEVADIYYRRMLWLLLFGLVHSWILLWAGEILYIYALCGLFLFAFRNVKPAALLVLGLLLLGVMIPKNIYHYVDTKSALEEAQTAYAAQELLPESEELSDEQQAAIEKWEGILSDAHPDEETIDKKIEEMRGGWFSVVKSNTEFLMRFQSARVYEFWFFDATGMMLIGMALLKWGVITGDRRKRVYLSMLAIGYAIGLSINAWETSTILDGNFAPLAKAKAGLTYEIGRLSMTMGHIGTVMLVCKLGLLRFLTERLAAVGRMALTNYVMHSVFYVFIFTGVGFGLFASFERHELYYIVGGIWLFQLIVSPIWIKYFRFGPLEWLWRSLTYQKRQPFKRMPGDGGSMTARAP